MNDMQKSQIINMRAAGIGYKAIAKNLDISENTVKSFCRRNNLTSTEMIVPVPITENSAEVVLCKTVGRQCHKTIKEKRNSIARINVAWLGGTLMRRS